MPPYKMAFRPSTLKLDFEGKARKAKGDASTVLGQGHRNSMVFRFWESHPMKGIRHIGSGKLNACAEPVAAHRGFLRRGTIWRLAKGVPSCSSLAGKLKRLTPFGLDMSQPNKALERDAAKSATPLSFEVRL